MVALLTHRIAFLTLASLLLGCSSAADRGTPHLPAGEAGKILARSIDAAGGWERWTALRDVAYVNTLTLLDAAGGVTSESIGWYTALLHAGLQARMESIGLTSEVSLGVQGDKVWGMRDGEPVLEPRRLDLARFNLASNLFWFSLPFALAEMPATVTDLGEQDGTDTHWHRLKVVFDPKNPVVPGEWFVLYIDTKTGLIDRVHTRMTAAFLRQELWVAKFQDYRDWDGLKKERRRKFFPADDRGEVIGNLVADQLVEHVRFNNRYPTDRFQKPLAPAHAAPAHDATPAMPQTALRLAAVD